MRDSRCYVVWVFIAIPILGCGDDPVVNPDITPDENIPLPGRIAFASDRDGDLEIYMINADGTSLVRLTESKGFDVPRSWSPDGRKLAFVSDRSGSHNIYVMSVDGSEPIIQLTHDSEGAGTPSWSPDGQRIAFTLSPQSIFNPDSEIYVMDADGNNTRQLTDNDASDFLPVWSPDGETIVFTSRIATNSWVKDNTDTIHQRYNTNIYLMNADGSDLRQLTHDNISGGISWSPDGQYMAFSYDSHNPYVKSDIYVMNANGSGRRALVDWEDSNEGVPIWGRLQ